MKFYLGTHEPAHLTRTDVPLFVSRHRLARRKALPRALGGWVLDSGGFSELSIRGRWTISPEQYAAEVALWAREIGNLEWAAIQDWMCEPFILRKTGLTIAQHQWRTIESYLRLRDLAPDLPWVPVLQGWDPDDYLRHFEKYGRQGIQLDLLPRVGVGSICRRQGTRDATRILFEIANLGVRIHGFGLKLKGLAICADLLASSDSMAWSTHARHRPPLSGCTHKTCANCLRYALQWRQRVLQTIEDSQPSLFSPPDQEAA